MTIDRKNLDSIIASDLKALVDLPAREGQRLEFKSSLPGGSDSQKREFLADVSAFANAIGGDILYGIAESAGEAKGLDPLQGDMDAEVLRLENMIRGGLDPRIPGVKLRAVPVDGGHVLVLRVPRSWAGPHVVNLGGAFRFFTRTSAGKQPLDVRELRALFALSESVERRVRGFRAERMAQVAARGEGVSLSEGASVVLHVVPVSPSEKLDMADIQGVAATLAPLNSHGFNWRHNLDGFLVFWGDGGSNTLSYTQVFRDGAVEMADTYMLSKDEVLYPELLEERIISGVARILAVQESLEVALPLVVLVSVMGVRGYKLTPAKPLLVLEEHSIDRDTLFLPEVVVQEMPFDPAKELKPIFDALWNAGGWPKSLSYDAEGQRVAS